MNNKAAKKLRRLSVFFASSAGKTLEDAKRIYKNLKAVHKRKQVTNYIVKQKYNSNNALFT